MIRPSHHGEAYFVYRIGRVEFRYLQRILSIPSMNHVLKIKCASRDVSGNVWTHDLLAIHTLDLVRRGFSVKHRNLTTRSYRLCDRGHGSERPSIRKLLCSGVLRGTRIVEMEKIFHYFDLILSHNFS